MTRLGQDWDLDEDKTDIDKEENKLGFGTPLFLLSFCFLFLSRTIIVGLWSRPQSSLNRLSISIARISTHVAGWDCLGVC